ncbi:MAG TPA: SH3 domain-containing protein [Geomonas sp.]|nr:SH3 domain-containing protein [Geomonas sp.]
MPPFPSSSLNRRWGVAFLLALLLSAGAVAGAAPAAPRPLSGCGVLELEQPLPPEGGPLVLYREPGLDRIGERQLSSLPRLAGGAGELLVAVTARKGGWTQLSYDEAGREGWVQQGRAWRYLSWEEFLPGRRVRVLPGLKKGLYALRSAPDDQAPERGGVSRDQAVRVLATEDDWARLEAPAGWVRWRDADGRLTISLQESFSSENR